MTALSLSCDSLVFFADNLNAWPWASRDLLGFGGYGVVYALGRLAAKVGRIPPAEVAAQRHFARSGLALPVLSYLTGVPLPPDLSHEVCPQHGLRREFLPDGQVCRCGQPADILLMPLAAPLPETEDRSPYTRAFIAGFARDCERELDRYWDARPSNVARYRGRLVALDFGPVS